MCGISPFAGAGLFLVEVAHEGNQAVAHEEVEAVARVAQQLLAPGTTWTDHDGATRALTPNDILVVAPYNAQVSALRTRLAALGVERVEPECRTPEQMRWANGLCRYREMATVV